MLKETAIMDKLVQQESFDSAKMLEFYKEWQQYVSR